MNPDTTKRWIEAKRTKRDLEKALREVNEEIENLQIGILEQMGSEGITQVKTTDGTTIFQRTVTKVAVDYKENESTDEGYERTCAELVRVGLGRFVKPRFYPQSIQSWIANDGGDKELLQGILRVTDIHELGVRNL